MQLRKSDYFYLQHRLANLGAFLTVAQASVEISPKQVERDEAWYDRQKLPHPSSMPHDTANLRPLLVALVRQMLWQESPSQLEAELDEARDAALPSAMSLCGLRDRITKHFSDQRKLEEIT